MLTREQQTIVDEMGCWYRDLKHLYDNVQTIGGYAGTGKTTIIPHIINENHHAF